VENSLPTGAPSAATNSIPVVYVMFLLRISPSSTGAHSMTTSFAAPAALGALFVRRLRMPLFASITAQ